MIDKDKVMKIHKMLNMTLIQVLLDFKKENGLQDHELVHLLTMQLSYFTHSTSQYIYWMEEGEGE